MRRHAPALLRAAVSLGLIVLLVRQAGGQDLVARIVRTDALHLAAACALLLLGQVLNAQRWRMLLAAARPPEAPPLGTLLTLVLVGMFYNFFLPSTVGGDVLRAEIARRHVGGRQVAYASILVARLLALAAIVTIALGSMLLFADFSADEDRRLGLVALALAALAGAIVWLLGSGALAHGARRLGWHGGAQAAAAFRQSLLAFLGCPAVLIRVYLLAIVANVIGQVLVVAVLARGMGIAVDPLFHLLAVPPILLLTLIPVTLNGIGLREGAFAYFYAYAGVAAPEAIALSLVFTATMAALALSGGVIALLPRYSVSLK